MTSLRKEQNRLDRKQRELQSKLARGEITRAEYNRRLHQSMVSRQEDVALYDDPARRSALYTSSIVSKSTKGNRAMIRRIESRTEAEWLARSTANWVGSMLNPAMFESDLPDLFSIGPMDLTLFKTEFTVAPNSSGDIQLNISKGVKEVVEVVQGVATFGGLQYYTGGPNGRAFDCYKWADTDNITSAYRIVGESATVTFEGSTLVDSGMAAIACLPPYFPSSTPLPPVTYDQISSYDYSTSRAVRNDMYQPLFPFDTVQACNLHEWGNVIGTTDPSIAYAAEGINYAGTFPNNERRIRVVVYQLVELCSVTPYTSGGRRGASGTPYHPQTVALGQHIIGKLHEHHKSRHGHHWNIGKAITKLGGTLLNEGVEQMGGLAKKALPMALSALAAL